MQISPTFDRERLKIRSRAIFKCDKDDSFTHMCPNAITVFWTALISSPESSLLNFSCKMVQVETAGQYKKNSIITSKQICITPEVKANTENIMNI